VKLTTHLHLVPRSKNAWSYTYTPSILGALLNTGTTLLLHFYFLNVKYLLVANCLDLIDMTTQAAADAAAS